MVAENSRHFRRLLVTDLGYYFLATIIVLESCDYSRPKRLPFVDLSPFSATVVANVDDALGSI